MEWLEIIKLRTDGPGPLPEDLLAEIAAFPGSEAPAEARVYAHGTVSNDLMILLRWRTDAPRPWGSDVAQGLSRELKRYGLVDYSVWSETHPPDAARKRRRGQTDRMKTDRTEIGESK